MSAEAFMCVMSFEPRFCPNCGKSKLKTIDKTIRWEAGESRECKCGVIYQRAWSHDIINAAVAYPGEEKNDGTASDQREDREAASVGTEVHLPSTE